MTFWKKNKLKIIIPALIVLALAAAFVFGDRNMPQPKAPAEQPTVAAPAETPEQDAAAADTPDNVETEPAETPAETLKPFWKTSAMTFSPRLSSSMCMTALCSCGSK